MISKPTDKRDYPRGSLVAEETYPGPRLRRATGTDLDAIYDLEVNGFVAGIVEDLAVFSRRIAIFPEGFLVLETAGSGDAGQQSGLLGYFCAEIWSAGDFLAAKPWPAERFHLNHDIENHLDRSGQILYIASMTVARVARGSGLGRQLFRQGIASLCRDFPDLARAVLIVNEHWHGARRLYASEGFAVAGRLDGFFKPLSGQVGDAIIMERNLLA